MGIYEPHMFRQTFLLVCFKISGKLTAWHFNSLLIPVDQTEKLRDVMAAYLLYKRKHLCILFRVVSSCLTKNSVYTAYSRPYNQSHNMISVM